MKICVYGSASDDINSVYLNSGEALGELIAKKGHSLIFGGGAHGMMGAVNRGLKKYGGYSIGVTPELFHVDGLLCDNVDNMIYTKNMHDRKEYFEGESDAFIVTPGGLGTFDELFEVLCFKRLGFVDKQKKVVILNINGFFDDAISLINKAAEENFMPAEKLSLFFVTSDIIKAISYLEEE